MTPSTKAQELLEAGRRGSREEDFRAAERASKNLLASILGKKAAAPPQQFYGAALTWPAVSLLIYKGI